MNLDELVAGEGEVLEGIAEGIDGNVQVHGATRESTLYRAAVLGRLGTTMNVVNEVQQHQVHELADIKNKLEQMQSQLQTLAYAPARRRVGGVEDEQEQEDWKHHQGRVEGKRFALELQIKDKTQDK